MKTIKSVLPKAGMIFLIFTLLCGVIYTVRARQKSPIRDQLN